MHIAPQVSDLTCECNPPLVIDLRAGKRHVTKRIALEGGHTGAISTVRVRLVCVGMGQVGIALYPTYEGKRAPHLCSATPVTAFGIAKCCGGMSGEHRRAGNTGYVAVGSCAWPAHPC